MDGFNPPNFREIEEKALEKMKQSVEDAKKTVKAKKQKRDELTEEILEIEKKIASLDEQIREAEPDEEVLAAIIALLPLDDQSKVADSQEMEPKAEDREVAEGPSMLEGAKAMSSDRAIGNSKDVLSNASEMVDEEANAD